VLKAAVRADVTGFFPNPPASNESYTFEINRWALDSLVALDRGLNVVPALAEAWLTPDDRTFILELRPGLRFADGRALRAQDAAVSLTAAIEKAWPNVDYLRTIEGVRALDDLRLEVRARRPDPTLLARLAWGFVLPAEAGQRSPVPTVGAGPYTLERWTPGVGFTFARNSHYWGPPASFARAEFRIVPEDEERVRLVEQGEADLADNVPLDAWERLAGSPDLRLVVGQGHRVLFLGLRVDRPPFRDPRVREAVDLAIDRRALRERVLEGKGALANQILPMGVVGHVPELPASLLDRERARRLLAESGIRPGHRLRLDGPFNRYVRDGPLLAEVARQLAEVGLVVEVNALDKRQFYALLEEGRSDFHLLGWASESGDGGDALDILFHPPGEKGGGRLNSTGLDDARLQELTREAQSSTNLRTRAAVLRRAFTRLAELRPLVPLVVQPEAVVYNGRRLAWNPPVSLAVRPGDLRPAEPKP
jgi:peptide/nickel transport system substrate-binding protein